MTGVHRELDHMYWGCTKQTLLGLMAELKVEGRVVAMAAESPATEGRGGSMAPGKDETVTKEMLRSQNQQARQSLLKVFISVLRQAEKPVCLLSLFEDFSDALRVCAGP